MNKPLLFLDFDYTLFDTAQFYEWLNPDPQTKLADLLAGRISGPDFKSMIYPDTLEFLHKVHDDFHVVILSYGLDELQNLKLEGTGIVSFADEVIITKESKGKMALEYFERTQKDPKTAVFLDDRAEHVSDVKLSVPEVKCVLLERTGVDHNAHNPLIDRFKPEEGNIQRAPDAVVHDLNEFFALLHGRNISPA